MESSISVDVFIKPRRVPALRRKQKKLVKLIYVQIAWHTGKDSDDIQPPSHLDNAVFSTSEACEFRRSDAFPLSKV